MLLNTQTILKLYWRGWSVIQSDVPMTFFEFQDSFTLSSVRQIIIEILVDMVTKYIVCVKLCFYSFDWLALHFTQAYHLTIIRDNIWLVITLNSKCFKIYELAAIDVMWDERKIIRKECTANHLNEDVDVLTLFLACQLNILTMVLMCTCFLYSVGLKMIALLLFAGVTVYRLTKLRDQCLFSLSLTSEFLYRSYTLLVVDLYILAKEIWINNDTQEK